MVEKGSSDLHITTGSPPQLRIDGALVPLKTPPLTPVETKQLCYSILADAQKHKFEEENELDLSFGVKGLSRFRANIFMQRGAVAAAFRTIPFKILTFQELGLPPIISELAKKPRGLVLVIGQTGHLAFGTLHTNSCVQTINRILDVFPPYQQPQIRAQLSFVLEGVVTQNLIAKSSGPGRVLAIEVMVPNAAIRNLIREDKVHQIYSQMQVGQSKFGMQTFNQSLASLIQRGLITLEEGLGRSSDSEELRNMLASGVKPGVNRPVQAR